MTKKALLPTLVSGYLKDRPDNRDRMLFREIPRIINQPQEVNLERYLPEIHDQDVVGACVAWSTAQTARGCMMNAADGRLRPYLPSPVFLYRQARLEGGYLDVDSGTENRLAWKAANKYGMPLMTQYKPRYLPTDLPDESTWEFPAKSIWRRQPPKSIFTSGLTRQAVNYFRIDSNSVEGMIQCLADGWLANIGYSVFRNFYDDYGNPQIDIRDPTAKQVADPRFNLGGHSVVCYGYSIPRRRFLLRNQWGPTAHLGTPNFTLSFDYMLKYSDDWWTCRLIEGAKNQPKATVVDDVPDLIAA